MPYQLHLTDIIIQVTVRHQTDGNQHNQGSQKNEPNVDVLHAVDAFLHGVDKNLSKNATFKNLTPKKP